MTNIRLFSTGGTIAKRYDEISGVLVFDTKHVEKMLAQGRSTLPVEITQLMLKDSLELDNGDRDIIFDACQKSSEPHILITHGTDTMVKTAKKLSTISDKTIVLTGSMIPYAFKNSDAIFNLAFSISSVQTLPYGIYICMNGQIFTWNNVLKNKEKGLFEKLF